MSRTFIHINARSPLARPFAPVAAPKCPTCNKSVYAAEQVLGPAAIPYHKRCLKCVNCSKILDAINILEHGYDPYCKLCHSKCFGTKGVGYGNAVVAEYAPRLSSPSSSSPTSPNPFKNDLKSVPSFHPTTTEPQPLPSVDQPSLNYSNLEPNRDDYQPRPSEVNSSCETHQDASASSDDNIQARPLNYPDPDNPHHPFSDTRNLESRPSTRGSAIDDSNDFEPPSLSSLQIIVKPKPKPTDPDIAIANPRSRDLSATAPYSSPKVNPPLDTRSPLTSDQPHQVFTPPPAKPPKPTIFSTRSTTNSPYNLPGHRASIPSPSASRFVSTIDGPQRCPSCDQTVYHAEQVLAIGKKWHKRCLRCWNCKKALDSNLNERDGKPYCAKCYDTQFGAAAHGFVLRAGFTSK